jgi:anti-sigma factor RsiW
MNIDHDAPPSVRLRSGVYTNEGLDAIDPDLILVADYIAGELPDGDERVLEARLERDDDLRKLAQPMLLRGIAARSQRSPAPDMRSAQRWRVGAKLLRFWRWVGLGVVALATPIMLWLLTPDAARQQMLNLEAVEQRASTEGFWRPQIADSVGTAEVARGVRVTPAPEARLTVERLQLPARSPRIALDGTARIDVQDGARVEVVTVHGTIQLGVGNYSIRSEPKGGPFSVESVPRTPRASAVRP